jgi:Mn-dependent DtxR family transcriptional regulator
MDVVPRRILEVISELTESERQWVGIRGVAKRVPCHVSVASYRLDELEADGYLILEKRGNHPVGITLTKKAKDQLSDLKSLPTPALSGQIADIA